MQRSPFPGMDPYLELHWLDVHQRLITYMSDQLQDRLPADLCARVEERVVLEDEAGGVQIRHPDVRIFEQHQGAGATATAVLASAAAPSRIVVHQTAEPLTESYIEVVDAQTRSRVISTIELVSPTNKRPGHGRDVYLQKQSECRAGRVNLIEIDLTRSGRRDDIFPWLAGLTPQPLYLAGVVRATHPQGVELHEFPLDRPLKPIRIPLRPADEDAVLELQPLIEQAYHRGRYGTLDYSRSLDPPLPPAEAEFARQMLQQANKL